jgi:alkylation response protein AidB-like acyl-CoA dehydrogenase
LTCDDDFSSGAGSKAFVTNHAYCAVVQVNAVAGERPDGRPELTVFMLDAASPGVRRGATWPTIMDDGLTGTCPSRTFACRTRSDSANLATV